MSAFQAILYGSGCTILAALAILAIVSLVSDLWFKRHKIMSALRGQGR